MFRMCPFCGELALAGGGCLNCGAPAPRRRQLTEEPSEPMSEEDLEGCRMAFVWIGLPGLAIFLIYLISQGIIRFSW